MRGTASYQILGCSPFQEELTSDVHEMRSIFEDFTTKVLAAPHEYSVTDTRLPLANSHVYVCAGQ